MADATVFCFFVFFAFTIELDCAIKLTTTPMFVMLQYSLGKLYCNEFATMRYLIYSILIYLIYSFIYEVLASYF